MPIGHLPRRYQSPFRRAYFFTTSMTWPNLRVRDFPNTLLSIHGFMVTNYNAWAGRKEMALSVTFKWFDEVGRERRDRTVALPGCLEPQME
ncbi:hypothetical protein I7I48_08405 [Histoplasma ohiense]|nr:hypothetical protein I7I48_08405 [Histoplasma ohiense (nom. inval.)]